MYEYLDSMKQKAVEAKKTTRAATFETNWTETLLEVII